MRIRFPVRRFSAAGNYDTRAALGFPRLGLHRCCQVHRECHGAQHAIGVVHEPDEIAQAGFADQVDHSR